MEVKGCIFDLDGTLLDSMHVWKDFAASYLASKHIVTKEALDEVFASYRMEEAIAYLHEHYLSEISLKQVHQEILEALAQRYQKMKLKQGVKECILHLYEKGIPLSILSANETSICKAAMQAHGLLECFTYIISCEDIHTSKREGACFQYVMDLMDVQAKNCIVVEDAVHAIKGAKQTGCMVVGMKEESQRKDEKEIIKYSDAYIKDMRELEEIVCKK